MERTDLFQMRRDAVVTKRAEGKRKRWRERTDQGKDRKPNTTPRLSP